MEMRIDAMTTSARLFLELAVWVRSCLSVVSRVSRGDFLNEFVFFARRWQWERFGVSVARTQPRCARQHDHQLDGEKGFSRCLETCFS